MNKFYNQRMSQIDDWIKIKSSSLKVVQQYQL